MQKIADRSKGWRSRDAWFCVGSVAGSQVIIAVSFALVIVVWGGGQVRGLNSFLLNVTGHAVAVLIAVGFSRVRSVNDFKESFEFHPPSNRSAFVAVLIGAAIGMFAAIGSQSSVPHNRMVESFDPSDRGYLNIILLLAPFTEEVVLRGYLYKAFRQNYSPILSTIYILIFTVVLHLGPFSTSFIAAVSLLCLNIATCVLREKTGSLWNCVIAHLTYNVACILG